MSKAFALAGARLGYLAAAPEICDALRLVRLPYHLSAVTQAAARAALAARRRAARPTSTTLRAERDRTVDWLRGQRATRWPSHDANFVLFGRFADRHAVWQALLDRGVLIRETGPDGWLRVTVGTADEMAAFTQALDDVSDAQETEGSRHEPHTHAIERQTKESKVLVELDLDGTGRTDVSTGVGFYDHMLTASAGTRWST